MLNNYSFYLITTLSSFCVDYKYDKRSFMISENVATGKIVIRSILYGLSLVTVEKKCQSFFVKQPANGCVPIYVYCDAEKIAISNNLIVLADLFDSPHNPFVLKHQRIGTTILNKTRFKNIFHLMNGDTWEADKHSLQKGNGFLEHIRYHKIVNEELAIKYAKIIKNKTTQEIIKLYGELFLEAVEENANKYGNGVFLSGGIDSVAVAAALKHLNKPFTYYHFARPGYITDTDTLMVKCLAESLKINGRIQTVDWKEPKNIKSLIEAIHLNHNTAAATSGNYYDGAVYFAEILPCGASVFNGELNFLDISTSQQDDKYRKLKRFLFYNKQAKKIYRNRKPNVWSLNKKLLGYLNKSFPFSKYRLMRGLDKLHGLLTINNPVFFYSGKLLHGLPGRWLMEELAYKEKTGFDINDLYIGYYERLIKHVSEYSPETSACLFDFIAKHMTESSNLTVPRSCVSSLGLKYIQPFNHEKLVALTSVLPIRFIKDKKVLREFCFQYLKVPQKISYNLKNHKNSSKKGNEVFWTSQTSALLKHINIDLINKAHNGLLLNMPESMGVKYDHPETPYHVPCFIHDLSLMCQIKREKRIY